MNPKELVTVYHAANEVEAEIVKNALDAEGIRCFVEGAYAGQAGILGSMAVQVQVPAADAERARRIIVEHEKGGTDDEELD